MNFNICIAEAADYSTICEVGKTTFYETWRPVNTENDMQLYMKKEFDGEKIKSDILNSTVNTFLICYDNKKPIGYVKLRRDRTYEEFRGERVIELERIYVKKEWQDKKAGKALMDFSIDLAKKEKYLWLWLGVNIDNFKAIRFYKQYGFVIFGEKAFQLGEAVDNDYLMKLKLAD
jgi:ribosomal protein S18 acetylase RimI-like enzyme